MVKTEECIWTRETKVYWSQGIAIFLSLFALAFGITCIIFTARANVCNTSGPTGVNVGRYPSPPNQNQPRNCIPECQASCAALYVEGATLLKDCKRCLNECTHPWGKNIDTCVDSELCDYEHTSGIFHYCQGMAYCYSKCAGGCLKTCRDDGYIAAWTGITSFVFALLPFFTIPIIAGPKNLVWVPIAVFSFLPWLAGLLLGIDALNLNMNGKGWSILWDPLQNRNITPNYMVGLVLCLLLIATVLMLFAFWHPREVWYRNQENVKQEELAKKLEQERKDREEMARQAKERADAEAKKKAEEEKKKAEEVEKLRKAEADKAEAIRTKLADEAAGKAPSAATAPAPATAGGADRGLPASSAPPPGTKQNVTIGLSFASQPTPTGQEVVVDGIVPNGPAAKIGVLQKGDVVCSVGPGGAEPETLQDVFGKPIETWAHIVKDGPPGTKVRFVFARHSEAKRFFADIMREAVP